MFVSKGYLVQGQDLVQVQIPQELYFEFKVSLQVS
jgi:hypothetical protein